MFERLEFTWLKNGDMIEKVEERDTDIRVEIVLANSNPRIIHFDDRDGLATWVEKNAVKVEID